MITDIPEHFSTAEQIEWLDSFLGWDLIYLILDELTESDRHKAIQIMAAFNPEFEDEDNSCWEYVNAISEEINIDREISAICLREMQEEDEYGW